MVRPLPFRGRNQRYTDAAPGEYAGAASVGRNRLADASRAVVDKFGHLCRGVSVGAVVGGPAEPSDALFGPVDDVR